MENLTKDFKRNCENQPPSDYFSHYSSIFFSQINFVTNFLPPMRAEVFKYCIHQVYCVSSSAQQHGFHSFKVKGNKAKWRVRGKTITSRECSIFFENVSVFNLCVIINPSFLRRLEIGMVLTFLTSSNSLLKLHIFWQLFTNELADWNVFYTKMFV